MKLYVWEDVLYDYTPGMVVVLAPNLKTARSMAQKGYTYHAGDFNKQPKVYKVDRKVPVMFGVYGGG